MTDKTNWPCITYSFLIFGSKLSSWPCSLVMYTTPLGTNSSSLCLNHQIYADGTAFPVLSCICFPPQYHSQNAHQQGIWPFIPLHFRSGERKVHRENFRSCGTFVPWNIRSRGAKSSRTSIPWNFRSLWNFRSSGVNVPRTFVPWNFRTVERSLHKQLLCPSTIAPVELSLPYLKKLWKAGKQCFIICWQTFTAVYL